ncbi:hypothetical protein FRC03_005704 [Tulasnella sp. 419]|nr:hypothetical protein FRC03_005704 [Tulasnella sp. 419]
MTVLNVPSIHCDSCVQYITEVLHSQPIENLTIDVLKRSLSFTSKDTASSSSVSSETHLIKKIRTILREAGYESHVDAAVSASSRLKDWFRSSKLKKRHKEHCATCRGTDVAPFTEITVSKNTPQIVETTLSVGGMTCGACTSAITSHLNALPGIVEVTVNLVSHSAVVLHDAIIISPDTVKDEIDGVGYDAAVISTKPINPADASLCQTTFGVEGMTCSSCTQSIERALKDVRGIQSVNVQLMQNSMSVVYDKQDISPQAIISIVEDTGFGAVEWETKGQADMEQQEKAKQRTIQLQIDGMYCEKCPDRVRGILESLPLVSFTAVTEASPVTKIIYTPSNTFTIREIIGAFNDPFSAKIMQPTSLFSRARHLQAREARKLSILFAISLLFAIPTFVIGIVGMVILKSNHPFRQWCEEPVWGGAARAVPILGALATIVQFGVGSIFYKRAFPTLFRRSGHSQPWKWKRLIHFGNMDLLVALSTTVAWAASVAMMILDVRRGRPVHEVDGHGMMAETAAKTKVMTYFDSSVFLIFFILMGRALEGRARVKTGDAIAMLSELKPENALLVIREDEKQSDSDSETLKQMDNSAIGSLRTNSIPLDHLELGDQILLRPGSIPPADGKVMAGTTTFDESSLTGESLPVAKQPDDSIFTGTTNLTSPIVVRVDKLGDETVLQKIVQAVSEAHGKKAPIEHLADRITSVFVPVIVWLSVAVLSIWLGVSVSKTIPQDYLGGLTSTGDRVFFAFEFAIAVLVVACPCGIGLAAPTAQTVGSGMAAKLGVLAKGGGEAFQLASQVDTVVFDKTGTLTTGVMKVVDVFEPEEEKGQWAWLSTAVRLIEAGSSHPLAKAIVEYLDEKLLGEFDSRVSIVNIEEVAGKGMKASVTLGGESYELAIGNEALVGVAESPEVAQWKSEGKSVVLVSVSGVAASGQILGFAISDTPRSDSMSTIAALKKAGKEVFMLSGDNPITATAVGKSLGIEESHVVAGVLPQEKSKFILELRDRVKTTRIWYKGWKEEQKKSVVLFCGDGLNDAAAIAAADVGVALAHGSQITLTTASFVLLSTSSSLTSLASLLNLSAKVYRRQKLNFGWAMIYNVGMIPLAAGAFYPTPSRTRLPPVFSALAMALSSGSVVLSSLALKWGL